MENMGINRRLMNGRTFVPRKYNYLVWEANKANYGYDC